MLAACGCNVGSARRQPRVDRAPRYDVSDDGSMGIHGVVVGRGGVIPPATVPWMPMNPVRSIAGATTAAADERRIRLLRSPAAAGAGCRSSGGVRAEFATARSERS